MKTTIHLKSTMEDVESTKHLKDTMKDLKTTIKIHTATVCLEENNNKVTGGKMEERSEM